MTLAIGRTLGNGVQRSLSTSGLVVFLLTALSQLLLVGATNTLVAGLVRDRFPEASFSAGGYTLPVSTTVAGGIALAATLLGVFVVVIATRLFARESHSLSTLPGDVFTRRLGRAFLSVLAVSVIITPFITVGMLLVIPGLFLAVSFLFAVFVVGVEDAGPVTALRRSWTLSQGNRWRLLALLLGFTVLTTIVSMGSAVLSVVDPAVAQLVSVVALSAAAVVLYGVLADAFLQLRDDDPATRSGSATTPAADAAG